MEPDSHPRAPLRTLQMLHALAQAGQGLRLVELSARLDMPKTSLFRLLRALEQAGYVSSIGGLHDLGPQAIALGLALGRSRVFPGGARPTMQWLAEQCSETVILGTFDDSRCQIVYIDVIEPSNPLRFSIKPGLTKPLYSSAIGQSLLAWMQAEERARYLASVTFERLASGTVHSVTALKRRIKEVRAHGMAISEDGMFDGVYSIAVPILDAAGRAPAGLSISAPTKRGAAQQDRFASLLRKAGAELSQLLGYSGPYPAL
jgi:DNA-binding IclR family transcriptional regulator